MAQIFAQTIHPKGRRTKPKISTIDAAKKRWLKSLTAASTGGDR